MQHYTIFLFLFLLLVGFVSFPLTGYASANTKRHIQHTYNTSLTRRATFSRLTASPGNARRLIVKLASSKISSREAVQARKCDLLAEQATTVSNPSSSLMPLRKTKHISPLVWSSHWMCIYSTPSAFYHHHRRRRQCLTSNLPFVQILSTARF